MKVCVGHMKKNGIFDEGMQRSENYLTMWHKARYAGFAVNIFLIFQNLLKFFIMLIFLILLKFKGLFLLLIIDIFFFQIFFYFYLIRQEYYSDIQFLCQLILDMYQKLLEEHLPFIWESYFYISLIYFMKRNAIE